MSSEWNGNNTEEHGNDLINNQFTVYKSLSNTILKQYAAYACFQDYFHHDRNKSVVFLNV